MQVALNATHRLEHPETYQQTIQDFLDHIDQVVGEESVMVVIMVMIGSAVDGVDVDVGGLRGGRLEH